MSEKRIVVPSNEEIAEVFAQLCPQTELLSLSDGPSGYSSRLWVADTDEGQLLVRLPMRTLDSEYFRGMIVVTRLAAEAGIPVPRFRAFCPETILRRPVIVQEFRPGVRATDAQSTTEDSSLLRDLAETLGDWIGKLHTVTRETFGDVLGQKTFDDWPSLVRSKVKGATDSLPASALPISAGSICDHFERMLVDLSEDVPACLIHGDLYLDNVLVHDGRPVCLLDFEHGYFADRFAEFGKLNELLFGWFPEMEAPFMASYQKYFLPSVDDGHRRHIGVGLYELTQLSYFNKWQPELGPVYVKRFMSWFEMGVHRVRL